MQHGRVQVMACSAGMSERNGRSCLVESLPVGSRRFGWYMEVAGTEFLGKGPWEIAMRTGRRWRLRPEGILYIPKRSPVCNVSNRSGLFEGLFRPLNRSCDRLTVFYESDRSKKIQRLETKFRNGSIFMGHRSP